MENRMGKGTAIAVIVLFALFLAGFAVAFVILPDRNVSETENRTLQTFPEWDWERWKDGGFASDMNDYFADQFPMREDWVALKGLSSILIGRSENNGVLLGADEQLGAYLFDACAGSEGYIEQTDGYSEALLRREAEALSNVNASFAQKGIPFTFLLAPRTLEVAASSFAYPESAGEKLIETFYGMLPDSLNAPAVIPKLKTMYEDGRYVMYRTDHHWTTRGAYEAYRELMKVWNMEADVLPESAFTVESVPDFYGTAWSRAGLPFVGPDTLELWTRTGGDPPYTVTDLDSGKELPGGLYSRSYLDGKDKYGVFLDGTHNRLLITDPGRAGRETLLIAKDSFANCMIPFLANHFDLLVLNLSDGGDETHLTKYAEQYGCSRVLVLYGLENALTSYRLTGLR